MSVIQKVEKLRQPRATYSRQETGEEREGGQKWGGAMWVTTHKPLKTFGESVVPSCRLGTGGTDLCFRLEMHANLQQKVSY